LPSQDCGSAGVRSSFKAVVGIGDSFVCTNFDRSKPLLAAAVEVAVGADISDAKEFEAGLGAEVCHSAKVRLRRRSYYAIHCNIRTFAA
jgi:hypothetical protein